MYTIQRGGDSGEILKRILQIAKDLTPPMALLLIKHYLDQVMGPSDPNQPVPSPTLVPQPQTINQSEASSPKKQTSSSRSSSSLSSSNSLSKSRTYSSQKASSRKNLSLQPMQNPTKSMDRRRIASNP